MAASPLTFGNADPTSFLTGEPASGGMFSNFGDKLPQLLMGLALLDSGRPRVNPPTTAETMGHLMPMMAMFGQQQNQKNLLNYLNTVFKNAPSAADLVGGGAAASPDISAYTGMPGQAAPASGAMAPGGMIPGGALRNVSDPRGLVPFIQQESVKNGIDPDTAVKVAQSEGLGKFLGDGGKSGGAFQLYTGGGEGNNFQRATGLDPLDPQNEKATISFALQRAAQVGWEPWHGAKRVGIGQWDGIMGAPGSQVAANAMPIPTQGNARMQFAQATPQTMTDAGPQRSPNMVTVQTAAGPVTYDASQISHSPTAPVAGDTQADLKRKEQMRQQDPYLGLGKSGVGATAPAPAAAPSPVIPPRTAVGQAYSQGALPGVSQQQVAQAQAAMPSGMPPRSPETVTGARTQAVTAAKMFDYWGKVAVGAGMLPTGGAGIIELSKAQMALAGKFMEPTELQKNIQMLPPALRPQAVITNLMQHSPEQAGQTKLQQNLADLQTLPQSERIKANEIIREKIATGFGGNYDPNNPQAGVTPILGLPSTVAGLKGAEATATERAKAALEPTTITVRMPDGSMVERQVTRQQYAEMVGGGAAAASPVAGAPQPGGGMTSGSAVFGKPYQTPAQIRGSETRAANEENQIPVLQKEGEAARTDITLLRSMKDAAGNIHQGVLAGPTQTVARVMRMVDPSFDKQVAGYEELTKNAGTFVRNAVRGTDSNPSTQQFNMIAASLPQPETSPLGFRRVTDQMLGLAQYKAAKAQALPAYEQMNGGSHAGYENWFYKNVTPYAFIISSMHPDDRKELYMKLQGSDQGKRELQMLRPQLEFIHQQGLDQ